MRRIRYAWITIGMAMVLTLAFGSQSAAQVIVGGYPYPAYRYAARDSAVRFDVKPNDAAVYLDGYYAGNVDDFDGVFQRLYTAPGGHEVTLYLPGYRTITERVYLTPDHTFKMHHRMERLPDGEVSDRPPVPPPPPQFEGQGPQGRALPPPRAAPTEGERGTLSLSIQPNDAEVLVDGSPWRGQSQNQDRVLIDLPEGRHNIQIRKSGFVGYLTDVQIRRGDTTTLDVRLKPQP